MADAAQVDRGVPAFARWLLIGVLGLAAVLRIFQYLQGRPLWLDEAMLALNIGKHSFLTLLHPLEYGQAAPPLFLWAVEGITWIGGMSEYALRFLPFVAGSFLPWLVWRTGKALVGFEAALIATALAAVSVLLIRYSAEAKQYGVDAFVGIGLAFLALRIRAEPDRGSRWWQLLGAGVAGMALSFSAVFVLAGCLASLLADGSIRRDRSRLRRLLVLGGGLGAVFGGLFLAFYLPTARSDFMLFYWGETFLRPGAPGFFHRIYGLARSLSDPFPRLPDQLQVRLQAALIVLGGLMAIRRSGLPAAAQIVVPFVAFTLGALLTPFPISERLQLFLAPFSFLAAAVVVAEVLRLARLRLGGVAAMGSLLMLGWGTPRVLDYSESPTPVADSREPARLVARGTDLDPVYVSVESVPLWAFYSTDWARPDFGRLLRLSRMTPVSLDGRGRIELVGDSTGQVFTGRGWASATPNPGWARQQTDRIAAVARPSAWVFSTAGNTSLVDSLRAEFARRGMTVRDVRVGTKTVLLRVSAPGQPRTAPP